MLGEEWSPAHEYPMLMQPESHYEMLKDKHGLVLGALDGFTYQDYEIRMAPGSRLFVYTDGLPEATDTGEQMFGTDRALEKLNQMTHASARETVEHMRDAVSAFTAGREPFDDLTMLCLIYCGKETLG